MPSSAPSRPRGRRLPLRPAAAGGARVRDRRDTAPVTEHLTELRGRIIRVTAWLLVAFAGCYWQRAWLFDLLDRPLDDRWPLQTLGVTEPLFTTLSVAAQAAFVLTTPVLAWHAWRFVRPAVAPDARRAIRLLLLAAPLLFSTGVAFGYFVVLGPAVRFLLGIAPDSFDVVVRASEYYSFVATTLLAIGAAFCFPLALLGAARVGVVTGERLRSSRRVAYVLMVVLAAMLPTADPVSLALEILPLVALYELSVLAVAAQERRLARARARVASPAGSPA